MLSKLRFFRVGVLVALVTLLATACATQGGEIASEAPEPEESAAASEADAGSEAPAAGGEVTIGSAGFGEAQLLGEIYAQALEEAGFEVTRELGIGTREVYFPSLENGEVDLLPEYLGSTYNFLTEQEGTPETEVEALRAQIEEELPEGLVLLDSSEAQDQDALAVTQETADQYSLTTVSDLAPVAGELVAGGPSVMQDNRTGLPGLRDVYGIEFQRFEVLDEEAGEPTRQALQDGRVQVARVFSTLGYIAEDGLVVLEEDEELIPPENVTPIAREEVVTPEFEEALAAVSEALTTEDLTELNRRVQIDQEDIETVATDWLTQAGVTGG
jgi:osmoprotectant transport system substrate-binding protein